MMIKITKTQIIYELDWDEVLKQSILPFLESKYDLVFDNLDNVRIRVSSKANAMVKPDSIQFKLPENIMEG